MALRAFYESDTEVPAAVKDHYALDETSGRYLLAVEGPEGWALEDVKGLRGMLGKLKQEAAGNHKALVAYQALGQTPDQLRQALEEAVKIKEAAGDEPKAVASLKAQIAQLQTAARAELEKTVGPIQEELGKRVKQVRELLVDQALTAAIADAKGRHKILRPALEKQVRVEPNEAGELVAVVVDSDGTPRVAGKDLRPMTIRELVEETKTDPDWAAAFDASGNSGGGTRPTTGGQTGSVTPEVAAHMSMADYRKARAEGRIP